MAGNVHQDDADKLQAGVTILADSVGLATSANQTTIIGHIDGVETTLTSIDGKDFATSAKQDTIIGHIDQIEGYVDGIETLLGTLATSANQTTIIGHIDQLEGYVDGIETLLSTIDGVLDNILIDTTAIKTAVQIMDDWDDGDACKSVGDIAHDSSDGSSKPIKIGAKATDYEPDSSGEQGASDVAAADRVNIAANLKGEIVPAVKCEYWEPDNIDTTYDDDPTTATSSWHDCWQYRHACFGFEITESGSATDIMIEIWVDLGDGNAKKLMNGFLGRWKYDDTSVSAGCVKALEFPIAAYKIQIKVICTGTDASNTFTMANSVLFMRT